MDGLPHALGGLAVWGRDRFAATIGHIADAKSEKAVEMTATTTTLPTHHAHRMAMRELIPPAALAGAAVALGGMAGLIVGFAALLLLIDRLLDRLSGATGGTLSDAQARFRRLDRARRREALLRRLRRSAPAGDELEHLRLDIGWAATAPRRSLGVQPIAIDSIVGTVERDKAAAFDREFRPPRWSRGRWTLLCLAAQRGAELPPISVYRVGDRHYLADGHHRVSVARALDAERIEAEVVELRPPLARPALAPAA